MHARTLRFLRTLSLLTVVAPATIACGRQEERAPSPKIRSNPSDPRTPVATLVTETATAATATGVPIAKTPCRCWNVESPAGTTMGVCRMGENDHAGNACPPHVMKGPLPPPDLSIHAALQAGTDHGSSTSCTTA